MWSLWEKITTPASLPVPEGPTIPGGVDVMTEYSSDGAFIRVYYPSNPKKKLGPKSNSKENLYNGWITWIPEYKYLEGCAKLMYLWKILVWAGYGIIAGMNASIPVSWGSQFAPTNKNDAEEEEGKNISKHPVVIISHGMAGTRFSHSALGLELASNGFVVASVEHRDGSASATYHFKSEKDKENGEKTWLPYKHLKFGNNEHLIARKEQVEQRSLEIIKALDVLEKINNGEIGDKDNLLKDGYDGMAFSLSQMKGRLDFTYPALVGYSFGGPSTLLAIKKDSRFRRVVGLDVWMFPIKDSVEEIGKALAPLLHSEEPNCSMMLVNSQTFHNAINVKTLKNLLDAMKDGEGQSKVPDVVSIIGTTHEHLCDWPLLLGSWLDLFLPGKLIPVHGHQLLSNMVMRFLAEPYSTGSNHETIGLTPHLKSICDEYISAQIHHFAKGFINEKSKI